MPLFMAGCLGTRHLKGNEKRLVSQTINSSGKVDEEMLRELYAQKTNRRFLGIPGVYHLVGFYYFGEKRYDKEKFIRKKEKVERKFDEKIKNASSIKKQNNLQFRRQKKIDRLNSFIENGNLWMQWGEPVAIYDSALVKTTIDRFSNYLFSEGFFVNNISTRINTIGKYVSIAYRVEAGEPYIIDTIVHNISDQNIIRILNESKANREIKEGDRYSERKLSLERERIDLLLKDNGYYDFSRQYIEWAVDTVGKEKNKTSLMLIIRNPARRGYHKQFRVDSVRFTTDAGTTIPGAKRTTRTYRDIQYSYYQDNYNLKILSQRLAIAPGALYSRTNTFNSQRQLANLDAFKFVNVNYDTSGGKFIANVFTSPLNRYEWSNEIGMNVTQGFPGPFYNLNFKKRNIFKGLENFELNARIGIEGVASAADREKIYKSTERGVNASLVFPQFIWPFRDATQIRVAKYNPKTRLSVGSTYSKRPEYTRTAVNLSNTYTWQNKRITQYSFAPTNISLINSDIAPYFKKVLDSLELQGFYNLARSFQASFVSSMIFGITWNRDYGTYDKDAIFIRAQLESGGTSLNFIDTTLITKQGLQYFKYLRFSFDVRKIHILTRWASLAYRFNSGIAYSYGSKGSLPYEKFFFAGGSNSVRAWRPRRLGLGSVPPSNTTEYDAVDDGRYDYQLEKPGEILLEGSIELRSKIVGVVDGAIFLDAGNVWSFRKPVTDVQGDPQFKLKNFYKDLGIGTGFGFRFNLPFLILRFDIGMKVYDPSRTPSERFVLDDVRFFKPYATEIGRDSDDKPIYGNFKEPVIYNIGIGFPF